jgi:hypothetical protein
MAIELLTAVPTTWLGVLIVGAGVAAAVGGLLVVRRFLPAMILRGHNDVAGFIYAVLGVIYAVLLPFVLVVVWEEFREAEHGAMQEAQTLAALRQDGQPFPEATRHHVVWRRPTPTRGRSSPTNGRGWRRARRARPRAAPSTPSPRRPRRVAHAAPVPGAIGGAGPVVGGAAARRRPGRRVLLPVRGSSGSSRSSR